VNGGGPEHKTRKYNIGNSENHTLEIAKIIHWKFRKYNITGRKFVSSVYVNNMRES
jgi:hypothetical protein